ncbi:hypothetical protein KY312_01500 [Candidatus Woesearchaeota archaeon]|nr:hypothetical protein [Candidatus Woesearchaeota archaeon]
MKSEQFEEKIRRISECEVSLTHQTTAGNAISVLEHGLMSWYDALDRKIKVEENGYVPPSYVPGHVSLFENPHIIFGRGGFVPDIGRVNLIIDPKYINDSEKHEEFCHYIYDGIIPPEDILGMISDLDSRQLMESQRERLQELTPVFFYDRPQRKFKGLYVPEWLEVSDEVRRVKYGVKR